MLPPTFWLALESVPGGSALYTIWKRLLGPDLGLFKSLFLKERPDQLADAVPCPFEFPCNCFHKVVPGPNGALHGLCQCDVKPCHGTYTVLPFERIPLELDWPRIAVLLARAFDFQPHLVKLGHFNTIQLGVWSPDSLPVVLTLASSVPEFTASITAVQARAGQPFILLAPTHRNFTPVARELLDAIDSLFLALEDHLRLTGSAGVPAGDTPSSNAKAVGVSGISSGPDSSSPIQNQNSKIKNPAPRLVSVTPPAQLFADLAPLRLLRSEEEIARRTFLALQPTGHHTRAKPPTLYTVYQLYFVKNLSIPQVARQCHCSTGTVANRIRLLRLRTGADPELLRRVAPRFVEFKEEHDQALENYGRRTRRRFSSD